MKKNDRLFYPAIFKRVNSKKIEITFPDLNCTAHATSDSNALLTAREKLGQTLCQLEDNKKKLPKPTQLHSLKLQAKEAAVLVDVFMPAARSAHINSSVSRSVTLPAYLNALALENNINFSRLLQKALKEELGLK